jgi:hypothetical protein
MIVFRSRPLDMYGRECIDLGHCRFKGGGSTTVNNTSTYTPTKYELQLQNQQAKYAKAVQPNAKWLNTKAKNLLDKSLGVAKVNFTNLNNTAQKRINNAITGMNKLTSANTNAVNRANSTLASLQNGELPSGYQQAMENSIATALKNTMGQNLNSLAQRGVLNSSVTNKAMNDIASSAADTVAQQYQSNINMVGNLANQQASNSLNANNANSNLYGNIINSATGNITAAAAAQEAAQQPAINLWNASLGLNGATTGALAAASGKGTTSSTSTTSGGGGGGGFFSGLMGGLF